MKRSFSNDGKKAVAAKQMKRDENNNVENSTELQNLPQKVLDAIFYQLPLNDLCSLNEAGMKRSTGAYFQRAYKSKRISLRMNRNEIDITPKERYVRCFAEYIQDVNIFGGDITLFKHVARHLNKSPKKIRFTNLLNSWPSERYGECLKETLKNVEIVEFWVSRSSGEFFNSILKYCKNMKSLRIRSQCVKEDRMYNLRSNWYYQKYPTLESIQWDDGVKFKTTELNGFFKKNLNIKNFTVARNARNALKFILDSDIILDQLTVHLTLHNKKYVMSRIEHICDLIKLLYARKKIKRFQLIPSGSKCILNHSTDKLSSLKALERIFLIHCNSGRINLIPSIASLTNLKTIYIVSLGDDANMIADALTKLEEVYIEQDSIGVIIPFATKSPNMKLIVLSNVIDMKPIKIRSLINRRSSLHNAKKLNIFIKEEILIALPGALNIDHKDAINFNRVESLHNDHPFFNYKAFD